MPMIALWFKMSQQNFSNYDIVGAVCDVVGTNLDVCCLGINFSSLLQPEFTLGSVLFNRINER